MIPPLQIKNTHLSPALSYRRGSKVPSLLTGGFIPRIHPEGIGKG